MIEIAAEHTTNLARGVAAPVYCRAKLGEKSRVTVGTAAIVQHAIAFDFLCRRVGDRIATMTEYRESLGVGAGTVQKAISSIEEFGAVTLRRRGHKGTIIEERNCGRLWSMSNLPIPRIAIPAPGPLDTVGLLHGLKAEFRRVGIPLDLAVMPGSQRRIEAVHACSVDVAVLSQNASERGASAILCELERTGLGRNTYYSPNTVLVLSLTAHPNRTGPLKIGIDYGSNDHLKLTLAEFAEDDLNHEFVTMRYNDGPANLLSGAIDFCVWHTSKSLIPLDLMGISSRQLGDLATSIIEEKLSEATLVTRRDNRYFGSILSELIPVNISDTQKAFLDLVPESDEFQQSVWLL